jgi:hypothetical protein
MAKKFLVSIDLTKQELQNAAIHNLATAPSSPSVGQVYFNTIDLKPYIWDGDSWNPFGEGTVTSVALSLPSIFTVTGSPITTSGTLTAALASQTANTVFAAPNGSNGAPSFRALVSADIPNLDASKITTGLLSVARGGTGVGTLTGVVIGNGTSAMTSVAGTASQLLRRNAGNTAYEFFTHDFVNQAGARSAISLTTTGSSGVATYSSATGVLNIPTYTLAGLGGFANPMTTLGDVIYGAAAGAPTRLAGNITTTRQFLSQTGTGSASAIPVWAAIAGSDVTGAALTATNDTNVTVTLGGTPATSLLRAASITLGWTGTLAISRGGTGLSALGTANQLLRVNSGATALEYFTPSFLTTAVTSLNGLTAATQTFANDTNVTITSATSTHTIGWSGQLAVSRGGTGTSTLTGVVIGNGASAMTAISGAASQVLRRNAGNTAYEFVTPGTANTLATLDSNGKVPTSQIPDSVLGQVEYINTWNASTNTPTLPSPTGVKGDYYVVSVAGTQTNANFEGGSLTFAVGDWVISNGTIWQKVDNTDAVVSVFGRIGAVVANAGDYNGFYVRHDTASQGLNSTQQSNARANIGIDTWYATRTFAQTIGNATASTFNIDHNLNSRDVVVQVYDVVTNEDVEVDITRSTVNRVIVTFNIAPPTSSYRVVVKI